MAENEKKKKKSTTPLNEPVESAKDMDTKKPFTNVFSEISTMEARLQNFGTTISATESYIPVPPLVNHHLLAINSIGEIKDVHKYITAPLPTYQTDYLNVNKIKVDEEIIDLKKRLKEAQQKLNEAKGNKEEVEKLYTDLQQKEINAHVIRRIHRDAVDKYLSEQAFRDQFEHRRETKAIVVSIDIRRSTELMLKARKADLYSDFITELSNKLSHVIIGNYGIFDKFTGDGILAFFPEFYSGEDAILFALKAAQECHEAFIGHYEASKDKFSVFIQDVGLGIGVDYGVVTIVNTGAELTVVGRPVVYACRFGGAKAGETLMNIEAYEILETKSPTPLIKDILESEIYIKNEGNALAFRPIVNLASKVQLKSPDWLNARN